MNEYCQELKRDIRLGQDLGIKLDEAFPKRSPFPLDNFTGMAQVIIILKRT